MNEMVIFYVLFSITVVLFILLLLTFFSWERWKTNFRKELAFRPADVSDYTIPRYVYANGSESPEYEPENGRIVGCPELGHQQPYIHRYQFAALPKLYAPPSASGKRCAVT